MGVFWYVYNLKVYKFSYPNVERVRCYKHGCFYNMIPTSKHNSNFSVMEAGKSERTRPVFMKLKLRKEPNEKNLVGLRKAKQTKVSREPGLGFLDAENVRRVGIGKMEGNIQDEIF